MFKDYYEVLGISRNASLLEIKTAYRAMSIKWHPDKNKDDDVTSKMQDINEAYAILKNEEKRVKYNMEYDTFFVSFRSSYPDKPSKSYQKYEYDYEVHDNTLKEDIASARQYAKDLVEEFLRSFKDASRKAAKGAWDSVVPYLLSGIILSIIGLVLLAIVNMSQ